MSIRRVLVAAAVAAAALIPLFARAQSTPTAPGVCVTDCLVEYQRSVTGCGGGPNASACTDAAAAAYKTCLAACPR
jgi:hypothetical protein